MRRIYQILEAPNDTNGNPRRITCQYSNIDGGILAVYEHGYRGDCLPLLGIEDIQLPTVNISVSEYQGFKAAAKSNRTYHI